MSSATERLANYVSGFKPGTLPEQALYCSKVAMLDCLGVALAGHNEPVTKILCDYATASAIGKEATLWGIGSKVSVLDAALVNGAMAHALDYDDVNRPVQGHPSVALVPAVLAVSEKRQCSGRKSIEAYVVGFEVMIKLGRVLNPGLYDKGWHASSVLGVMGACASASYLLGLSHTQTLNALGISASEASGIKRNFGSMTKPLHVGSAARKGIWAAILAQKGITANPQALDGTFGFLDLFRGDMSCDLGALDDLGNPLEIIASGLVFKQYACCGSTHPVLDGIIDIQQKECIEPDSIKDIECRLNPRRIPHIDRPKVGSGLEAKFSLQYCVATAIVEGRISLAHFRDDLVLSPMVEELMKRVRIVSMPALGEFACDVIVRTADGRVLTRNIPETRGSPSLPLTESQLFLKFVDCATTVVTIHQAEEVWKRIMNLERETNVSDILRLLSSDD